MCRDYWVGGCGDNEYNINTINESNEKEDSQIKDLTEVYLSIKEPKQVTTTTTHIISNSVHDNNLDRNNFFIEGNKAISNNFHSSNQEIDINDIIINMN